MALAYSVNDSVFLINLVPSDKGVSLDMQNVRTRKGSLQHVCTLNIFPLNPVLRLLHQEEMKSVVACHLCQDSLKKDLICEDEVAI